MKKLQILGKSLSKIDQKKINGGLTPQSASCTCNDGFVTPGLCRATCMKATVAAQAACSTHGGWDTCTLCVNC